MHSSILLPILPLFSLLVASIPIPTNQLWEKIESREVTETGKGNTTTSAPTTVAGSTTQILEDDDDEDVDYDYAYNPYGVDEFDFKKRAVGSKVDKPNITAPEEEDVDIVYAYNPFDFEIGKRDAATTTPNSTATGPTNGTQDTADDDEEEHFGYPYDPSKDDAESDEDVDYVYTYDPVAAGELKVTEA